MKKEERPTEEKPIEEAILDILKVSKSEVIELTQMHQTLCCALKILGEYDWQEEEICVAMDLLQNAARSMEKKVGGEL